MKFVFGKAILGSRPEEDFKVKMIGQTKSGVVVENEAPVHVVLWTPAKRRRSQI
jgi:hypothetical protein